MPVLSDNHLRRARFERDMADASATNIERIIHNKLAALHVEAGKLASTEADTGAGKL